MQPPRTDRNRDVDLYVGAGVHRRELGNQPVAAGDERIRRLAIVPRAVRVSPGGPITFGRGNTAKEASA